MGLEQKHTNAQASESELGAGGLQMRAMIAAAPVRWARWAEKTTHKRSEPRSMETETGGEKQAEL